jgi:nitrite reductase/ring-hydroxylating ferredoxin subunit/DMSO/TMAO reductase YedYZ heme-binding membrane subunit
MSGAYKAVGWNRQKKIYDGVLAGLVVAALAAFMAVTLLANPNVTAETLVIRSTALCSFLLLHVILCIGPLARLDRRFMPLLYNRRHLGVTMFLLALLHAIFVIIQFHSAGDKNPLVSVFTAYKMDYNPLAHGTANISNFPFEPLGFVALVILFLMAATSHDFWLKNLGASFWKALHQLVYVAYGLLVLHVALGVLQSESEPLYPALLGGGFFTVTGLHLAAYRRERKFDRGHDACGVADLVDGRANVVLVDGRRVAVWLHQGKVFATSNVCRHQGGPVGEGRIIDGCITCPWHGWQYRPEDGCSPPPFHEVIPTFNVTVEKGRVFVSSVENPLETKVEGVRVA